MSRTDQSEPKTFLKPPRQKRNVPAIGKQEALEMLASAINYCQQSGLLVRAGNVDGKLALTIEGAHVDRSGPICRFIAGTQERKTCQNCGQSASVGVLCAKCASNPNVTANPIKPADDVPAIAESVADIG